MRAAGDDGPRADRPFFDTNVALYLLSGDARKAAIAEDLLAGGGILSAQVLNEFVAVARRKYGAPWDTVQRVLDTLCQVCTVVPLTLQTHRHAVQWSRKFGFSIYDATILASAAEAGCDRVFTEDLQHGQAIGTMRIHNPFL